jgi:hypothetical protein
LPYRNSMDASLSRPRQSDRHARNDIRARP